MSDRTKLLTKSDWRGSNGGKLVSLEEELLRSLEVEGQWEEERLALHLVNVPQNLQAEK
jgi:hypothetical protein